MSGCHWENQFDVRINMSIKNKIEIIFVTLATFIIFGTIILELVFRWSTG